MITRQRFGQRGTTFVETVLIIPFVLLCIFVPVKIAVFAYIQLQSDGSSYVAAHLNALNTMARAAGSGVVNAEQTAAKLFPNAPAPTSTIVPSPTLTTPPMDMGWNQPPINGSLALNSYLQTGLFQFAGAASAESTAEVRQTISLPILGDFPATLSGTMREAVPFWYSTDYIRTGSVASGFATNGVPYGVLGKTPTTVSPNLVAPWLVLKPKHWYCSNAVKTPCTNSAARDDSDSGYFPNSVRPYGIGMGEASHLRWQQWNSPSAGVTPMRKAAFWETLYHLQIFQEFAQYGDVQSGGGHAPLPDVWYGPLSQGPTQFGIGGDLDPKTNVFLRTMLSWDGFTQGCVTSKVGFGHAYYSDGSQAPAVGAAACAP